MNLKRYINFTLWFEKGKYLPSKGIVTIPCTIVNITNHTATKVNVGKE